MQFSPMIIGRPLEAEDQRRAAMNHMAEAFAEARLDGLETDCIAQAAVFSAFVEMVATYGEAAATEFAERLSVRVRAGEFTVDRSSH